MKTRIRKIVAIVVAIVVLAFLAGYAAIRPGPQPTGYSVVIAALLLNLISPLFDILTAPFGQMLIEWFDKTAPPASLPTGSTPAASSSHAPGSTIASSSSEIITEDTPSGNIGTLVSLSIINAFALVSMNIFFIAIMLSLDKLEAAKLLSFTALGYTEVQKFLLGFLSLMIWLPILTGSGFVLGRSSKSLRFWVFCAGFSLSMPVYIFLSKIFGLGTGLGSGAQVAHSIGAQLPSTPGYSGFEVTAISGQIAMIITIILVLSFYAWTIAKLCRYLVGFRVIAILPKSAGLNSR